MSAVVDAFAGIGWAIGLRALGIDEVGVEHNADVCALRAGLGLQTIRADVAAMPVDHLRGKVEGAIFSPPCQSFSAAGKRKGLDDPRGLLVREPLRWVEAMRPRWVACEQVPDVAPYWRAVAARLRPLGYSTWTGILDVADYGVPQNRTRAFLMASLDVVAEPPEPTHSRTGHAEMFGAGRQRWVSMAEALGWPTDHLLRTGKNTMKHSRDPKDMVPYEKPVTSPAPTVACNPSGWKHGPAGSHVDPPMRWKLRYPGRSYVADRASRSVHEPAPCIALGHNTATWEWETDQGALPVELWELGVLQGFPPDFPWHLAGTKTAQATIIGNAVPPPVASAVVGALTGAERTVAA